ncbi:MAG: DUF2922 domain-containing protein [Tepidanaerobacteraceae bacterium]|nr:DUF2922 domain-containing protein [Tepidanaerobacteraceae bacterium]
MDKNLELIFKNVAGRNARISMKDPKDDLTTEEVQTLMDNIVAKDVFDSTGGALVEVVGARLIQKEIIQLIG